MTSATKQKRILIVEDERPLAHALQLKLGNEGYEIVHAATGADGLKEAKDGIFDLILLDLILPGMDGFAVLEGLKKAKNKAPIIIVSNLGQDEDKKRAEDYGVVGYHVKANTPLATIIDVVKKTIK